ncbi:MAG TPA: tryptophan--tRNA ligase, partial [Cellulomonas sp.]
EIRYDAEAKPGIANLLTIFSALSGRDIRSLEADYEGKGYGDLKKDLADLVVEALTPFQERAHAYLADPAALDDVLADGAERAREIARGTLARVYDRSGFLPRRVSVRGAV